MIRRITIKNFQRHRDLTLDLFQCVTTLRGPSDAGKSSVLRALQWVITNEPAGKSFIHDGTPMAKVSIELTDGTIITRKRRKTRNTYELDGQVFEAFGRAVPEPIADLLNMDAINFQGQHNGAFWFSESAGEVSRQINQIINLGTIDTTLGNIASELRKATAQKGVIEDRLNTAKAARNQHKHAIKMSEELAVLEGVDAFFSKVAEQASKLGKLCSKADWGECEVIELNNVINDGKSVLLKTSEWEDASRSYKRLCLLLGRVGHLQSRIPEEIPDISDLSERAETLEQEQEEIEQLKRRIGMARGWRRTRRSAQKEARKLMKELEERIGDSCPLCGQEVKK